MLEFDIVRVLLQRVMVRVIASGFVANSCPISNNWSISSGEIVEFENTQMCLLPTKNKYPYIVVFLIPSH